MSLLLDGFWGWAGIWEEFDRVHAKVSAARDVEQHSGLDVGPSHVPVVLLFVVMMMDSGGVVVVGDDR